ncbi:Uncharacterised protein [Starkeya nomas]|uniref:Endonuclease/exonuclease/phosphatase domain-containing protein n=2 Tax=Starkeya nomas TaxID=2666134 RepID=A0A5S9P095_9HYPH|nr:Uncharacterised protein [Starkeya nomas]
MSLEGVAPSLRLMTWNIHGGIGPDRCFDLSRIAALVARHRPDILALQEVDTRGRPVDCLAPLGAFDIAHLTEAKTMVVPDGHYGHVLYSRWPMRDVVLHDLSMRWHEPRMAIETRLETPFGPLHLAAVHLGLAIWERQRQVMALATIARRIGDIPTVMMGDFNDWLSFGRVRRTMAELLPERTRLRSFPAGRPMLSLDRIYCSRHATLVRAFTDLEAATASDHLPVIADIHLAMADARREPDWIDDTGVEVSLWG